MISALIALSSFALLFLAGVPILRLSLGRAALYREFLLAPAAGLAMLVLFCTSLSLSGGAIGNAGPIFLVGAAIAGCVVLVKDRVNALPLAAWVLLLLLVQAPVLLAPLLRYGQDWIGFAHVDPSREMLFAIQSQLGGLQGTGEYVQIGGRFVFATLGELFGRLPVTILMPVMLALFFCEISAATAMFFACFKRTDWRLAFAVALILGTSSLALFGILNGNVEQTEGLTLACAVVAVLQPLLGRTNAGIRDSLLPALFVAALFPTYAEFLPFIFLSVGIALAVRRGSSLRKTSILRLSIGFAAFLIIALNVYLPYCIDSVKFFLFAAKGPLGGALGHVAWFIPSGIPNYWGIVPQDQIVSDPWISLAILAGITLSAGLAFLLLRLLRLAYLPAIISGIMLIISVLFFLRRADYALFKITEFSQPFVLVSILLGAGLVAERRRYDKSATAMLMVGSAAAIMALGLPGTIRYIVKSQDPISDRVASFVMVRHTAPLNFVESELKLRAASGKIKYVTEGSDEALVNYERSLLIGRAFFSPGITQGRQVPPPDDWEPSVFSFPTASGKLADKFYNDIAVPNQLSSADFFLVCSPSFNSILNGWSSQCRKQKAVGVPGRSLHDHLIFVNSSLGGTGDPTLSTTSLYLSQGDFLRVGSFAQVGRYLLFRLLNPTKRLRLMISLTVSSNGDGKLLVPANIRVVGEKVVPLYAVGRGSARLISAPVIPKYINGVAYIGLDMGRQVMHRPPEKRTGLMRMYGAGISRDPAGFIGLVRDISAIAESDVRRLRPPQKVTDVRQAIRRQRLFYSGAYEDGWVAEQSRWLLACDKTPCLLRVAGLVPRPNNNGALELSAYIDGKKLGSRPVRDAFDVSFAAAGPGPHWVSLNFSSSVQLSATDPRPASARLSLIEFLARSLRT